jgi:hypothetical protein
VKDGSNVIAARTKIMKTEHIACSKKSLKPDLKGQSFKFFIFIYLIKQFKVTHELKPDLFRVF